MFIPPENSLAAYQNIPEELVNMYPHLQFDAAGYLQIALDNTLGKAWETCLAPPVYKNLSEKKLAHVLTLLHTYKKDKYLLLAHNKTSLSFRK